MKKIFSILLTIILSLVIVVTNNSKVNAETQTNDFSMYYGVKVLDKTNVELHLGSNPYSGIEYYLKGSTNGIYSNEKQIPWAMYKSDITKIVIDTSLSPTSTAYWFCGLAKASSIEGLNNLDTTNVTDMKYMFQSCLGFTDLDLSSLKTSNVTNMSNMFYGCTKLVNLNLSGFNTANVTDMSSMFNSCYKLSSLTLNSFDTRKVTDMHDMFYNCANLQSLNLNNFDTSKVKNMSSMFEGCTSLSELNIDNFNTAKVETMSGMFTDCSMLKELDVSSFNTENVTSMSYMFYRCSKLESLDVSDFNTKNVDSMNSMFSDCLSLKSLDLSKFVTSKVTDMGCMFARCSSLTTLDLSSFDTSNVINMQSMFDMSGKSSSLEYIDLSNFKTNNVLYMENMFTNNSSLKEINVDNDFDTTNVLSMSGDNGINMFKGCSSLTNYDSSKTDANYTKSIAEGGYFSQYVEPTPTIELNSIDMPYVDGYGFMLNFNKNNGVIAAAHINGVNSNNKVVILENSVEIDPSNYYLIGDESLRIVFSEHFLNSLKTGTHVFKIVICKNARAVEYTAIVVANDGGSPKKDESCEKVIGPSWHWNNTKGICEEVSVVGTYTR